MKKILCLLIAVLFLFPCKAEALRKPDHIGQSMAVGTESGLVVRGDAKIWMVTLLPNLPGELGAYLTLYDEYQGSINEANIKMEIEVAAAGNSEVVVLEYPIDVSNGLWVQKSIGAGTYIILYE